MKIPEPRKLPSGNYFIQLRLGGESISVTDSSRTACIREARAMNAEYLAGKRAKAAPEDPTLTEAIDSYIVQRSNTLSPLTIWCYRSIQKHRFQTTMPRRLEQIDDSNWHRASSTQKPPCARLKRSEQPSPSFAAWVAALSSQRSPRRLLSPERSHS